MDETLFLKEGLQLLDLVHNVLVDGFPATSQLVHALVLVQVLRSGFFGSVQCASPPCQPTP